jgi:hypothetical protein
MEVSIMTNREAHEKAAGMGLDDMFFRMNGIDPDAEATEIECDKHEGTASSTVLSLLWKDVFNSQNVWPSDYHKCREIAKNTGYQYLAFNGSVYNVDDASMKHIICEDNSLK